MCDHKRLKNIPVRQNNKIIWKYYIVKNFTAGAQPFLYLFTTKYKNNEPKDAKHVLRICTNRFYCISVSFNTFFISFFSGDFFSVVLINCNLFYCTSKRFKWPNREVNKERKMNFGNFVECIHTAFLLYSTGAKWTKYNKSQVNAFWVFFYSSNEVNGNKWNSHWFQTSKVMVIHVSSVVVFFILF